MRVSFLFQQADVTWVMERFSAGTSLDGETQMISMDCVGEFKVCFAELCDCYRIKREFVAPNTL